MPFLERINRRQVVAHLRQEYVRGLTNEETLGYHGTSIYALRYCIDHGVLPGATGRGERRHPTDLVDGDLYLWKTGGYGRNYDPILEARSYALLIAQAHHLIELMGLRRDDRRHQIAAGEFLLDSPEFWQQYLNELGLAISPEVLEAEYIMPAERQKGLVLGIAVEAEERYPIIDVNELRDDGWRIETGGAGLPYTLIWGIQPIGEEARAFLENL